MLKTIRINPNDILVQAKETTLKKRVNFSGAMAQIQCTIHWFDPTGTTKPLPIKTIAKFLNMRTNDVRNIIKRRHRTFTYIEKRDAVNFHSKGFKTRLKDADAIYKSYRKIDITEEIIKNRELLVTYLFAGFISGIRYDKQEKVALSTLAKWSKLSERSVQKYIGLAIDEGLLEKYANYQVTEVFPIGDYHNAKRVSVGINEVTQKKTVVLKLDKKIPHASKAMGYGVSFRLPNGYASQIPTHSSPSQRRTVKELWGDSRLSYMTHTHSYCGVVNTDGKDVGGNLHYLDQLQPDDNQTARIYATDSLKFRLPSSVPQSTELKFGDFNESTSIHILHKKIDYFKGVIHLTKRGRKKLRKMMNEVYVEFKSQFIKYLLKTTDFSYAQAVAIVCYVAPNYDEYVWFRKSNYCYSAI